MGDKAATQPDGTGTLYIDNIRLYPPRCMASILKSAADLNSDCIVNYEDVDALVNQWLRSGLAVTPVAPAGANLVGQWKFDDGAGTTAADSSGRGNNGLLQGNPVWVAGHDSGALWFNGVGDYVDLPIGAVLNSLTNSTFAVWANSSNAGGGWQRIFDFGLDTTSYMFLTPRTAGAAGPMRFAITTNGGGAESQVTTASNLPSGWHHVAVTINADTDTVTLYQDGLPVAQTSAVSLTPSSLGATTNNWLGRSEYNDPYYMGRLDDFRIYNKALSASEVASLAGRQSQFSQPYDLNADGAVNLKDYAILASAWLTEMLWPQP